jgi:Domain of unknown function (DUF4388)
VALHSVKQVKPDDTPLAVRGRLAEQDLPHLVHELQLRDWSGEVVLKRGDAKVAVTVKQGQLVFAASSNPDHRLGPLLVRRAIITLRQLMDAGASVGPGKRLGTILVERGVLSPKELVRAVVDQTQEIIYHAFQWEEGDYELQAGAGSAESITLNISTPNIILEGIRRIESWGRIERGMGGLTARYARAEAGEALAQQMFLSSEQRSLLEEIGSGQDVEVLCERSTLSDFELCRTLWAFAVVGVVRRVDVPPPEPSIDDEGLAYIASGS